MKKVVSAFALALIALPSLHAWAQSPEATLRKNLGDRLPSLKKIDEVNRTPMQGLYEIRVGNDVLYSDAEGNYLIQGSLIDTRAKRNLTEERIDKLTAVDFKKLPFKDAFTVVRGNGKRQVAVFEDPNCGYCKRFEADLQKVNNITVHMFLLPILSKDSHAKSEAVWCSANRSQAWQDLMLRDKQPVAPKCDTSVLERNLALAQKHNITGTPHMVLSDNTRVPGAINAAELEALLAKVK